MNWQISRARDLVEAKFGRQQRDKASACINSVNQRVDYAEFHYHAIDDELTQFSTRLGDCTLLEVDLNEFMVRVGAHAVACVQSIHALEDLLAAMVYQCLNLGTIGTALDEHKLSLKETLARLAQQPNFAKVKTLLESLNLNPSFGHIAALSNKAKHSAIVPTSISQDLSGRRADALVLYFSEFERRGKVYPQVSVNHALAPAFDLVSEARVDIGNELTALLTTVS